ncbi:MAG: hypothetical protein JJU11_15245, partial [Candidatus Sumerlaeia bacterium]|nr:hypothetical protein [Candidatus Sumerlaeia bacterium]
SDNTWSYTPSQSGTAANGEYYFASVAIDNAGNVEAPPGAEDPGDVAVLYNSAENGDFAVTFDADGIALFPIAQNVVVEITLAGTTGPVTLTVSRTPGNNAPNGFDPAKLINEYLTITGNLDGATASISWPFDPANDNLDVTHNTVFQTSGGNLINVYPVGSGSNPVIINGITSFSDWWIGNNDADVTDWMDLLD